MLMPNLELCSNWSVLFAAGVAVVDEILAADDLTLMTNTTTTTRKTQNETKQWHIVPLILHPTTTTT